MMRVCVKGRGVAASASIHLLTRAGLAPSCDPGPGAAARPASPAVLLSDPAVALLRDVFGRSDLFADRPRIRRRIVSWGGSEPAALPHEARVLAGGELDAALRPFADAPAHEGAADFTIHAAPPFPEDELRLFGERTANAAPMHLLHAEDAEACWIESVAEGWLFMLPGENGRGWLLGVGAPLDALLAQSRHLAPRLEPLGAPTASFAISPRMRSRLRGDDWLACGTSAIAFDPICGDGTAQAAREAILSAAVLAGIERGEDREALLTHYESMLLAAMRRHLQLCLQFYETGGTGRWWRTQAEALREGFAWCTARLGAMPEPRFLLRGFTLAPREPAL
ncbi:conserved hypothetical protein [Altererythrobacter sp. B11]|uniref:hypothetical protein n=1 Tax=Altererythrobacter sp. B11 TaxID=2060312 RepID=UPI000DC714BD|nr:hypothetical protein [Altererythrobacter sp. B11]BBC73927.1 conserved hypothetical protein [Altererythrobacter sp. B11]